MPKKGSIRILTSFVLLCTLSQVSAHGFKQMKNKQVDMTASVLRGTASGLGFYEHVPDVQLCDDAAQTYFTMWVKAVSRFYYGDTNHDYLEGMWHLTDSMGQSSYVVRHCYNAYDGVKILYVSFFDELDDFPEFSTSVHLNIIQ